MKTYPRGPRPFRSHRTTSKLCSTSVANNLQKLPRNVGVAFKVKTREQVSVAVGSIDIYNILFVYYYIVTD